MKRYSAYKVIKHVVELSKVEVNKCLLKFSQETNYSYLSMNNGQYFVTNREEFKKDFFKFIDFSFGELNTNKEENNEPLPSENAPVLVVTERKCEALKRLIEIIDKSKSVSLLLDKSVERVIQSQPFYFNQPIIILRKKAELKEKVIVNNTKHIDFKDLKQHDNCKNKQDLKLLIDMVNDFPNVNLLISNQVFSMLNNVDEVFEKAVLSMDSSIKSKNQIIHKAISTKKSIHTTNYSFEIINDLLMLEIEESKMNYKLIATAKYSQLNDLNVYLKNTILECQNRGICFNDIDFIIDTQHTSVDLVNEDITISNVIMNYNSVKDGQALIRGSIPLTVVLKTNNDEVILDKVTVNY